MLSRDHITPCPAICSGVSIGFSTDDNALISAQLGQLRMFFRRCESFCLAYLTFASLHVVDNHALPVDRDNRYKSPGMIPPILQNTAAAHNVFMHRASF